MCATTGMAARATAAPRPCRAERLCASRPAAHAAGRRRAHNDPVRTEYRLTDEGELLDPRTTPPEVFAAARRRWIVELLPTDPGRWRSIQTDALRECGISTEAGMSLKHLADTVLGAHVPASMPDDVIAMRVAMPKLSDGVSPVKAPIVNIITQRDRAVTSSTDSGALKKLVERVRSLPPARRRGAFVVVRSLLSLSLEHATDVADRVTARTAELEDQVFSDVDDDDVTTDIYRLKRAIADGRRRLLPVINRLSLVTEVDDAELGEDAVAHLERIEAGFRRVADALDTDDRLLGDMLTAQMTLVQVQQNGDMRRISAYAALITVPTLIAGIYGMNFDHMPELHWLLGYPASLALMLVVVLLLRRAFRRSGWL
ncbi:MAG TPA: hypothetical protein DHV14_01750 [Micrococcales bacterium]|nr:hypothetical protein [Micrococcales bacterium]